MIILNMEDPDFLFLALVVKLEVAGLQTGYEIAVAVFYHHANLHQLRVNAQSDGALGRLRDDARHRNQSERQSGSKSSFEGHCCVLVPSA